MSKDKVIGVDLGGTRLRVGLVTGADILAQTEVSLSAAETKTEVEPVLNLLINQIEALFDESVRAIGIGVPSVVEREEGIVYDVHNIPAWREVALKTILEHHFKVPVVIDNDANCFALGERLYGKGREYENFVGITLGTGLGGGIISRGQLLADNNCGSGEFSEMYYLDGIVGEYSSGKFFLYKHKISAKELFEQAGLGDETARKIFVEFGFHLGRVLTMIMAAVDPAAIIIGGSIAQARAYFESAMRTEAGKFIFTRSAKRLKIEFSTLEHASLLGAAALWDK